MRSIFKVLFYLKRNTPKSDGIVLVMERITIERKNLTGYGNTIA